MPILYRKQGHTGILTLSRPDARNCWGQDYNDGLLRHLDEATDDDEVRSVILTGDEAGGAFSAGANLRDPNTHNTRSAAAFIKRVGRARNFPSNLLADFPKPVIAAVNGYAAGGGFELALAADMIVAAENAQFWLPEAQLGILPDGGGVIRLQRRIPKSVAVEMMMTGRRMSPQEALEWGLVSRVVPLSGLMDAARELAQAVAKSAPLSLRAVKAIVNNTDGMSVEEAYGFMRGGRIPQYRACLDSEDAKEGPASFAEGRAPVWKGR